MFILSADAARPADLNFRCPDGYASWSGVNEDDWYFGLDWDEFQANNTEPFTGTTGTLSCEETEGVSPCYDRLDGEGPVYPAGFRQFVLTQYSEPPICVFVPGSRDKKVEILMESPIDNANLCIHDAAYSGVGNNNVGTVENCGTGKIYACFTAATTEGENFGFYVDCETGCEDMDIDVWIRIRVSDRSWDEGKTDTASDLEHWCEQERGTTMEGDNVEDGVTLYYTYPSDLLPDEPSQYPFHIEQIFGRNAGSQTKPNIWIVTAVAFFGLACLFA